jgi:hypothetical protein
MLAALALASQRENELGARIAQSAAAAQALQGPLDGTWVLDDRAGRAQFVFQIADPASREAPLQAAWREAGAGGAMGPVSTATRSGERLRLGFQVEGRRALVVLSRTGRQWRGTLKFAGTVTPVTLSRDAP